MELYLDLYGVPFLQLVLAMLLGGALGIERNVAHKTAGMRTYALIAMGSALFILISQFVAQEYLNLASLDPLRMASQIIVGIGFVGAGLIIFRGGEVSGLTTAAGLWVAAGIGMAVGYRLYAIAIFATVLTLFIFIALKGVENTVKKVSNTTIEEKPFE